MGIRAQLISLVLRWRSSRWRAEAFRLLGIHQNHLTIRARKHPDKPCVIMADSGETLSYARVDAASMRAARLFRAKGLVPGNGIVIVLDNSATYFEVCWAAQRSGLYFTPINPQLLPSEAAYIIEDSGAELIVAGVRHGSLAQDLADHAPQNAVKLSVGGDIPGFERYEELLDQQAATPLPDETEGRSMIYSSGTTGRPKGIHSPRSGGPITMLPPVIDAFAQLFSVNESTVLLSPGPLYHAAPLGAAMAVQTRGGTCVVMEKFEPEALLAAIEKYRVTHVNLVPTMFVRLLKLPDAVRSRYDVSSLRIAIHGAAPCPVEVKERMIEWWGPVLFEYYSATEGNVFCCIKSGPWLKHKGSVGKPALGPVHILDEAGNECPVGEIGEIWSAAASDFVYHNDSEKTARSRNARGWTTVGDIGYLDADGYLYITDRKDFTIISNGVNIYPREAEDILIMHPQVDDVAVIGVPDPDHGEAVKAVVQTADGATADGDLERELIEYCRARLSKYKCPRSVDFMQALPRYDNGKLRKELIKERYWQ